MPKINSPADIQLLANTFRESRVFLTAYELGIFTSLDNYKLTSEQISEKLNTNHRATDRLMNVLVNLGLLNKENNLFANTLLASKFLVKGKPDYMEGLSHINNLWETWTTLTSVLKKDDKTVKEDNWLDSFIAAMHSRGKSQAVELAKQLDLNGMKKMLDVGGGSGIFSVEFLKANPELNAVVYDLPNVIPITKKYIEKENLSERIGTMKGDYLKDDIGSGYDMIFLSAVIHSNSPGENKLLIKKCFNALNSGGKIIVVDYLMSDDRLTPDIGALFAINMLVATDEGDTFTESEMREWLEEAGFKYNNRLNTSWSAGVMIANRL